MANLNNLFVLVPAGTITGYKAGDKTGNVEKSTIIAASSANPSKIYFLEDTNEIVVRGVAYGASDADIARIAALETTVNGAEASEGSEAVEGLVSKVAALQTLLGESKLGEDEDTVVARIGALETLVGIAAEGEDNTVIDRVQEVLDWFKNLPEEEAGAVALVADVAANKAAIGVESAPAAEGKEAVEATGIYKRIEVLEAVNDNRNLTTEDAAVVGKYVSAVSQNADGTIEVSREDLPELSVKDGSANYVGVDNHKVEIKTSALGDVNLEKNAEGKWVAPESVTTGTGLATAADVAAEIVANEQVVAAALNDHETRIAALQASKHKTSDVSASAGKVVSGVQVDETGALTISETVMTTVAAKATGHVTVSTDADGVVTIAENDIASAAVLGTASVKGEGGAVTTAATGVIAQVEALENWADSLWTTYTA